MINLHSRNGTRSDQERKKCVKYVFATYNIHSAVRKSPQVHSTISEHMIDILALPETWFLDSDSVNRQKSIAPHGYKSRHVNRKMLPGTQQPNVNRGGGLAVVYQEELDLLVHPLQKLMAPSTFERQIVYISSSPNVIIANLYRRPNELPSAKFFNELATLISALTNSRHSTIIIV